MLAGTARLEISVTGTSISSSRVNSGIKLGVSRHDHQGRPSCAASMASIANWIRLEP